MTATKVNIDELKEMLDYLITNNRYIQSLGMIPAAIAVEGGSGIGKTSTAIQLSQQLGLDVVKLNLAQIEELGDLVGFPIRQFQVCKDIESLTENKETECIWIDEHAVESYSNMGYTFTGNNRMSYCPPEWIADKKRGGILILDDFNRADPRFMQATMELIDRQTYISWKLPEDWHIILTNNPDNGDYNVTSIDDAQKTRFISTYLRFDIDCWARWAEQANLDSRCINFLLMHPEMVTDKVNARSITTFFNCLRSIKDFSSKLPLIQMIGEGSVGDAFSTTFTLFINNRLDKLMSPKDILFGKDIETILSTLGSSIGRESKYRADIASTIATRVVNYTLVYAQDNAVEKSLIERLGELIKGDIFANDLKYLIVRQIFNGNKTKFKILTMDSALMKYMMVNS